MSSTTEPKLHVLCFGASLVEGYNSGPEYTPYAKWMTEKLRVRWPAKHFDVKVDGVAGDMVTVAYGRRMERHSTTSSSPVIYSVSLSHTHKHLPLLPRPLPISPPYPIALEAKKDRGLQSSAMAQDFRILCFGDSLTEGYTKNGSQYAPYSDLMKSELEAAGNIVQIVTEGESGDQVSHGFRRRMERRYLSTTTRKPLYDWVVILGGTNDLGWGKKVNDIFEALVDVSNIPLENGAKILMMTVPECGVKSENLDQRRNDLNELIKNDPRGKVYKFDLYANIPYHAMAEAERKEIWDDGLHLTPKGYERMGELIGEKLADLINETE